MGDLVNSAEEAGRVGKPQGGSSPDDSGVYSLADTSSPVLPERDLVTGRRSLQGRIEEGRDELLKVILALDSRYNIIEGDPAKAVKALISIINESRYPQEAFNYFNVVFSLFNEALSAVSGASSLEEMKKAFNFTLKGDSLSSAEVIRGILKKALNESEARVSSSLVALWLVQSEVFGAEEVEIVLKMAVSDRIDINGSGDTYKQYVLKAGGPIIDVFDLGFLSRSSDEAAKKLLNEGEKSSRDVKVGKSLATDSAGSGNTPFNLGEALNIAFRKLGVSAQIKPTGEGSQVYWQVELN
ncbi:MAG: hypothetical protein D6780_07255 [Candidatus Dadabacteria bacterium]|nr:MAG: hypothetical protein D6780_07255 [Candidatus Dadabacteria bacterium]